MNRDELDLDAIASAVRSCDGVARLSGPTAPDAAPDAVPEPRPASPVARRQQADQAARAVPLAIAYDAHVIDISVIAFHGQRLAAVSERIEHAVRPLIGDRHLHVTIDDLDHPTDPNSA